MESLKIILSSRKARKHPIQLIFLLFIYISISLFISLWIFPEYVSLVTIFFSTLACMYIVQKMIIKEEEIEENSTQEKLTKKHIKLIKFLLIIFIGFLISFLFWSIFMPEQYSSDAFKLQIEAIEEIKSISGRMSAPESFKIVLSNNLRVLLLSFIISLFYAAGVIFIISWNASVLGYFIGYTSQSTMGLSSLPYLLTKYLLHGIPEIASYLFASLAGSILFISFIKGNFTKEKFKIVFKDCALLLIISLFLVVFAAIIECYISPYF